MATISRPVYTDDPAQRSGPDHTYQATINVSNQHNIFFNGENSVEKIVIHNPHVLGMKSSEQKDRDEFIEHVLLTCNLLLKHTRLSIHPSGKDIADFTPDERKPVGSTVEYGPDGPEIITHLNLCIDISTSIITNITEELDEARMRDVLNMINTVYDSKNLTMKVSKTRESLDSYHRGIISLDKETVFTGLYAALEKAVNFDRNSREGVELDEEVCRLMGDPNLPIKDIRLMNNRFKHGPKGKNLQPLDRMEIYNHVRTLLPIVSHIILLRLEEVTGN